MNNQRNYKQSKLIQQILEFEININQLITDDKLLTNLLRLTNSQKKLINSFFNATKH